MADVFISYSRKDIAFARLLHKALADNGLETWIDWQDIPPSADWLAEVYEAIEQADTFIFIISGTSLASEVCGYEIEHAAKNNKRLIPIVIEDVDANNVPRSLAALNWIFFGEKDEQFRKAAEDLVIAITVDQEWLKAHTRLQTRALEWERGEREKGYLLRGVDLSKAEDWLARAAGKDPQPSALQTEYILTSRKEAVRRQRVTFGAVLGGLAVAVVLGVLALIQRNVAVEESSQRATAQVIAVAEADSRATAQAEAVLEANARATAQVEAEEQRDETERQLVISLSRELAAKAIEQQEVQPDLALLLAAQAYRYDDNIQTRSALMTLLQSDTTITRRFLHQHESWVSAVDFSPDGHLMVSGGANDDIFLWDVASGQIIGSEVNNQPITGAWGGIDSVVFLPDGKSVVVSSATRVVLWEVTDAGLDNGRQLDLPDGSGEGMDISPDGRTLLLSGEGTRLLLVDIQSGTIKASIPTSHTVEIDCVRFSPDGTLFASLSPDDQVLLFDAVQQKFLKELSSPVQVEGDDNRFTMSRGLDFSPDGSVLAAGFDDGTIHRWQVPSGQEITPVLSGHSSRVFSVAFSPDGETLVSGGGDDLLIFWDLQNGKSLYEPFTEHKDSVVSVAFNASGTKVVSASMDSDIILWELERGKLPAVHTDEIAGLAFSPDGSLLASSGMDNQIVFWDVASGQMAGEPIETTIGVSSPLVFSPDGTILVSYCDGLCFYDVENRIMLFNPKTYTKLYDSTLAFSPDGAYLASGDGSGIIRLWNPETGTRASSPQQVFETEVFALAFDDSSSYLYAANGYERQIAVWDLNSGAVDYHPLVSDAQPGFFLRFSHGIQLLAAATGGASWNEVLMYDPANGEALYEPLVGHTDAIIVLAFSPDNQMLATAGADKTIRLWNTADGQAIGMPLSGHTDTVIALAFSPDGSRLASAAGTDPIRLWDLDPNIWLERACEIANRSLTREEWSTFLGGEPYQETCTGQ
ncbi:MAG: TIR domain-containing protein [Anaerolineales bacterium]|nr:TIR domain-containing protein [Anaerolineales bacterium]